MRRQRQTTHPRRARRGAARTLFGLLVVAMLVLVPVAQAFANGTGTVVLAGTGHGSVTSGGEGSYGEVLAGDPSIWVGNPPIDCSNTPGEEATVCQTELERNPEEPEYEAVGLHAVPATGSEFAGWTVEEGENLGLCEGESATLFAYCAIGVELEEGNARVTATFTSTGPAGFKLNLASSGSGSGTFMCKVEGGSEEPCAAEYEEGKSVEVLPQEGTGSDFVEFNAENGGECTGATCAFTMNAEHTANARFDLVAEPFSATQTGEGTVECEDVTAAGGPGACASSYPYGHTVKVEATEEAGWRLEGISGTGSAAGCTTSGCEFQITEASSVDATFAEIEDASTLTVFKGGDGEGAVKSLAPHEGIECGPACEEASATFEGGETIELEETPAEGSTFAGWLGCRKVSGTNRCRVTLTGTEPEVTAVFLAEGKEGPEGKEGSEGKEGPEGKEGKEGPEGKEGKEGSEGKEGPKGNIGATGATGPQGSQGPAGAKGPAGPSGAKGDTGAAGPQGATGPAGPQGPAGKVTVTCKVKYQGKKKAKVTCSVKYPKGSSQSRHLSWSLHRAGHVVSHGQTSVDRLQRVLNHLRPGHYRLQVDGQATPLLLRVH